MPPAKPITTTDIAEIQRRMAQIRHDMHQEVEGAVKGAQLLTDWRSLVKSYPWLTISLAAVVGYAIVPRRRSTYLDRRAEFAVSPEFPPASNMAARVPRKRPTAWNILGSAFGLLSPVAVCAVQNYALGHLEQWLSQHPLPPVPTGSPVEPKRPEGRPARQGPTTRLGEYG